MATLTESFRLAQIVSSDDRGRVNLSKFLPKQVPLEVHVGEDGTVLLRPQEAPQK